MALDSKIYIGWHNRLTDYTLSSSLAAESSYPLTNMLNQTKGEPTRWDMSSTTSTAITFSSATAYAANNFMLKGHNMPSDATVRLRLWQDAGQSGTLLYDSTATVIYLIIPWGEMIAGIDPWGNYYDPDTNLDPVFSLGFDTVNFKSGQIDISNPTPTNNLLEIDKMALFFGWTPTYNFEHGATSVIEDSTRLYETSAGGFLPSNFPARRKMEIDFTAMSDQDRSLLTHILVERTTKANDLYIVANPNATGVSKYMHTSIFKRANDAQFTQTSYNLNDYALTLREN